MMPIKTRVHDRNNNSNSALHVALFSFLLGGLVFTLWSNLLFRSPANAVGNIASVDSSLDQNLPGHEYQHLQQQLNIGHGLQARRRDNTLVVYIYNAVDEQQQRNFAYFLRYGVTGSPTYRIIITAGEGVLEFPKLPTLPANAQYLHTEMCTDTWGALAAMAPSLPISQHEYVVVVDSSARGPFLPPYVSQETLHWTEIFTSRINLRVKLVGSVISCEGAPLNGDASSEWRANPHVASYAWATDSEGWRILMSTPSVLHCHSNVWDSKYYSEVGGSLAILNSGYGLDSLMARYQGVDWSNLLNWNCNQRVRPDNEMHYDGISITPYETLFVPISAGTIDNSWSFARTAAKYEEWADRQLKPVDSRPGVNTNSWITDHWTLSAEKLTSMNTRGPGCFDFAYYVNQNIDLQHLVREPLALWEHFLLLGQFQGRRHRFTCPLMVGNSFRVAYVFARGSRCFDHEFYADHHRDLEGAGLTSSYQLFGHFAEFGQFERRKARFVCADSVTFLPRGFDAEGEGTGSARGALVKPEHRSESEEVIRERMNQDFDSGVDGAGPEGGESGEDSIVDPVQQALKSVLVSESVKGMLKKPRH